MYTVGHVNDSVVTSFISSSKVRITMFKQLFYIRWMVLFFLALSAWPSGYCRACGVPVFRYALERWPPDAYQVVVLHEGPLDSAEQDLVNRLKAYEEIGFGRPPLVVRTGDVTQETDELVTPVWEVSRGQSLPLLVLLPPIWEESTQIVWSAPLSEGSVQVLTDSPVRRELAERITGGQTAVWLFFPSGDKDKDAEISKLLEEGLPEIESSLKLPHEIDPNDTTYDMPLQSDVTLKIEFSHLVVDLDDPKEAVLAGLLHQSLEEMESFLPAVIPVFGRGRALAFLSHDVITREALEEICFFVVGPCSCQVKQMNPGMDLFIPIDWDGLVTGMIGGGEILPSLIVPAVVESNEPIEPNRDVTLGQVAVPSSRSHSLGRNLIVLGAVGFLAVIVGTGYLLQRSKKQA